MTIGKITMLFILTISLVCCYILYHEQDEFQRTGLVLLIPAAVIALLGLIAVE